MNLELQPGKPQLSELNSRYIEEYALAFSTLDRFLYHEL